jgi:hypothetical protein
MRKEAIKEWEMLNNDNLNHLYFTPNIINVNVNYEGKYVLGI